MPKIITPLFAILIVGVIATFALVAGALDSNSARDHQTDDIPPGSNVAIVDGIQIIDLYAKSWFKPKTNVAQAGVPTLLRVHTQGTVDCSSAIRIPSLSINKTLPLTGKTDIDIGTPDVAVLAGTCGMGMYPFRIDFQK